MLTTSDIDRLKSSIDKWGMALVNELQLLREAFVANNMSICESCANNPCNKKAMLGDRRIYECTLYERAEQTEPQTQLTAKCLECNNSKACKENHWEGCRYEPLGYEVTAVVGTIKTEPQTCDDCDQIGRCDRGRAVDCPWSEV